MKILDRFFKRFHDEAELKTYMDEHPKEVFVYILDK